MGTANINNKEKQLATIFSAFQNTIFSTITQDAQRLLPATTHATLLHIKPQKEYPMLSQDKLQETIESVLEHTPHMRQMYFDRRSNIPEDKRKKGYIVITGDKGLCGSYNHNILKYTEEKLDAAADLSNCYLFVMGQVGRLHFQRRIKSGKQAYVDGEFLYTTQNPTLYRAAEIADIVLEKFKKHRLFLQKHLT